MALATTADQSQALPLLGRVAIVTGSSRGIGRAIALHLASLGAKVVVNYAVRAEQAEAVAAEINSSRPGSAIVVKADVSDPSDVKSMFDAAEEAFGSPIHILVNSAAVADPTYSSFADIPVKDFDRIFSVNTRGAFLVCKEAANRLKRGGGGRIILLSSSLTVVLKPNSGAYTASKAAINAMTKILAKELRGTQITANCVAPGPIATEMLFQGRAPEDIERMINASPMDRLGETRDVAPVVGFLACDASEWVNGQIIYVNGGYV